MLLLYLSRQYYLFNLLFIRDWGLISLFYTPTVITWFCTIMVKWLSSSTYPLYERLYCPAYKWTTFYYNNVIYIIYDALSDILLLKILFGTLSVGCQWLIDYEWLIDSLGNLFYRFYFLTLVLCVSSFSNELVAK